MTNPAPNALPSEVKDSAIGRRRSAAKHESRASYRKKREEIAEAAIRVFNRLGYERSSISAVAAEMNVDRASLYYYISSKDELFDEIVRAVIERNADLAMRILESVLTPREKLRDVITALMSSYGASYPLIYIYIRENLSHVSDKRSDWSIYMRSLNHKIEEALIAIVEEGYADGSFRNVGPSKVVAYGVLGLLGWTHRWFRPAKSQISAEEIGQTYAEMVLSGLQAD